ncbi:bifunctional metallophosphatase/5'-nucleotidase [bacterium]|nr:bifunctional metallophosphatase/5'-nucleotidase [bacterium]
MKITNSALNFKSNPVSVSVGYVNDLHGQLSNMQRIHSAFRENNYDFKFSGGDNCLGCNNDMAAAVDKFMDRENFDASCLGNHEFDIDPNPLSENLANTKMKYLGANISLKEGASADAQKLKDNIDKSFIIEKKGEKFGVIGLAPCDLYSRVKSPDRYSKDFEIDSFEKTVETTQKEIDALKAQGVDKIFLLSHIGHDYGKKLAQMTSGIDVIIGGHTHELIKDVKPNENLVYSKDNEPVVITQAGRDGNYFGELNVSFDDKGIVTKVQNNVKSISDCQSDYISEYLFNQDLGTPETVGEIESAPPIPENFLIEENPHANFITDAMRFELGTDLAILNNANIRNIFRKGPINSRQIKEISPFSNKMVIIPLSEKNVIDALKVVSKSTVSVGNKPGLLAISGLNYKVNKQNGTLVSASYMDKDGNLTPIDINNPNPNKILRVALDDYCASSKKELKDLNNIANAEKVFGFDKDKLVCDYIKHIGKPVTIDCSGRITFEG